MQTIVLEEDAADDSIEILPNEPALHRTADGARRVIDIDADEMPPFSSPAVSPAVSPVVSPAVSPAASPMSSPGSSPVSRHPLQSQSHGGTSHVSTPGSRYRSDSPLSGSAASVMDTRAWISTASNALVGSLLRRSVPKETARLWVPALASDIAALQKRAEQQQIDAHDALQATLESSLPERAREIASERDRVLRQARANAEATLDAAYRSSEHIRAAVNAAHETRKYSIAQRAELARANAQLLKMAKPYQRSAYGKHVRQVIEEESSKARAALDAKIEQSIASFRSLMEPLPPAVQTTQRLAGGSPQLQQLADAVQRKSELQAIRRVCETAPCASAFAGGCDACYGSSTCTRQCQRAASSASSSAPSSASSHLNASSGLTS